MRLLLLNPWAWLIVVVVLLASIGGGYRWGHTAATTSCEAAAGSGAAKVEGVEDDRDTNVEAIAAATGAAVAAALNDNRGSTHESIERIRTVAVPGDCRAVDPGIVRELQAGAEGINAALGAGLRPGTAGERGTDP